MSVEAVVNLQLAAYNQRDIEAFAATYAEDVRIFHAGQAEPGMVGREALREHYGSKTFKREGLHAEILSRLVVGNKVIDHERASWTGKPEPTEVVVVYEVVDALIQNVWFFDPGKRSV